MAFLKFSIFLGFMSSHCYLGTPLLISFDMWDMSIDLLYLVIYYTLKWLTDIIYR